MSEEQKPQELSKEEIEKRRNEVTEFYKSNLKHLRVQKEYEELLRDIELARVERVQAQMFLSQASAKQQEAEEGEQNEAMADFKKAMGEDKSNLKSV